MYSHHGRVFLLLMALVFSTGSIGQTVWYPRNSSELLKSTASDLAMNLSKAITGSQFNVLEYQSVAPSSGIILVYDSAIVGNDACKIEGNGNNFLKFTARQDNGLNFGVYRYLAELGFRFYLPGSAWEKIPSLTGPYRVYNKTVQSGFKYNSWFISGGCNKWIMDKDASFSWDTYPGKNGHEWSKYQRRNNMTGAYRFTGHRGDLYTPAFVQQLQNNPCFVSSYNGERNANTQSTPDINNAAAKDFWATEIEKKYTGYKNTVTANPVIHANLYRNFDFSNHMIGLEVNDGSKWGNSISNSNCPTGNWNGQPYPSESDQQFLLVNHSAAKINTTLTDKRFQCYAYDGHANIPSSSITINPAIDIQVVPMAFQLESSAKGLLNRWYARHSNISEYHFLNIPVWAGESPVTSRNDLKQTIQRIKEKHAQGIVIEASPAKFASLPLLFAANRLLEDNISMDSSLSEFVNAMFSGNTAFHISKLLSLWGNEQVFTVGNFIKDNKYKLPLYLQLLKKAEDAAISENAGTVVMQRLNEIKAYLHYLVLYYDFFSDNNSYVNKVAKAEKLCLYLAKISDRQVVNSYQLIQDVLKKFPSSHSIAQEFNIQTGTAYEGGQLSRITASEIDAIFLTDLASYGQNVTDYNIQSLEEIMQQMANSNLQPLQKIDVKIVYTNGKDYSNRTEFYIYAPHAGSFNVNCTPEFTMPGKGFINITAEAVDNPLLVLKDVTITRDFQPGKIEINLPGKGFYKLTVLSKYKTNNQLGIETKGNTFFRNGPFFGNMVENYRQDLTRLPRFVYVPSGVKKLFFSSNNACPASGSCFTALDMQNAFSIRDQHGNRATVNVSTNDPSLFSMEVPGNNGGFWQVNTMREFNLCFANISNVEIYAEERKKCPGSEFSINLIKKGEECFTRLTAATAASTLRWEIYEGGRRAYYNGVSTIDLPLLSASAVITLKNGDECVTTKNTGSTGNYTQNMLTCSSQGAVPDLQHKVFPNPSMGKFNFTVGSVPVQLDEIGIFDLNGKLVLTVKNVSSVDLAFVPSSVYIYKAKKDGSSFHGKLVKL